MDYLFILLLVVGAAAYAAATYREEPIVSNGCADGFIEIEVLPIVTHKGGDAPKVKEQKIPEPPPLPPPPKPPAPPPPPPTESSADVAMAQMDQRRQAQKRRGIASTLLAGEQPQDGKKTLLG